NAVASFVKSAHGRSPVFDYFCRRTLEVGVIIRYGVFIGQSSPARRETAYRDRSLAEVLTVFFAIGEMSRMCLGAIFRRTCQDLALLRAGVPVWVSGLWLSSRSPGFIAKQLNYAQNPHTREDFP